MSDKLTEQIGQAFEDFARSLRSWRGTVGDDASGMTLVGLAAPYPLCSVLFDSPADDGTRQFAVVGPPADVEAVKAAVLTVVGLAEVAQA